MVVIMLNLVISVISETYGNVSQSQRKANNYEKTIIISDVDSHLSERRKKKLQKEIIRKYIFVGSTVKEEKNNEENVNNYIKRKFKKTKNKLNNIIDRNVLMNETILN